MIKIIISGGRDKRISDAGLSWLDDFLSSYDKKEIIIYNGAATGVDASIRWYCATEGIDCKLYPADWKGIHVKGASVQRNKYGKLYNAKAGLTRNLAMIKDALPDGIMIAFSGGRGTAHCFEESKKGGLKVIDLREHNDLVENL